MLRALACSLTLRGTAAAVAVVALAASAHAEDEGAKAKAYLRAGMKKFDAGDFQGALAAFKRGFEHKPIAEFHYRLAQCHEKLGDGAAAVKEYRTFLEKAPDAGERAEIEKYIASVEGGAGGEGADAKPAAKADAKPAPKVAPKTAAAVPAAQVKNANLPDASGRCVEGQRKSVATEGHCCWPEQVWSDDDSICIGIPRCPPGWDRKDRDCVRKGPACQGGKVAQGGHCCWPEQLWSDDDGACVGKPRCPHGTALKAMSCIPVLDEDEAQ